MFRKGKFAGFQCNMQNSPVRWNFTEQLQETLPLVQQYSLILCRSWSLLILRKISPQGRNTLASDILQLPCWEKKCVLTRHICSASACDSSYRNFVHLIKATSQTEEKAEAMHTGGTCKQIPYLCSTPL